MQKAGGGVTKVFVAELCDRCHALLCAFPGLMVFAEREFDPALIEVSAPDGVVPSHIELANGMGESAFCFSIAFLVPQDAPNVEESAQGGVAWCMAVGECLELPKKSLFRGDVLKREADGHAGCEVHLFEWEIASWWGFGEGAVDVPCCDEFASIPVDKGTVCADLPASYGGEVCGGGL